jgi:hypothetical protein
MNEFSYHILPIIHAYNACISQLWSYARLQSYARIWSEEATLVGRCDSGCMLDSSQKTWLWSHITTLVAHHGFDRRSYHMSYLLICERLHMVELDDCSILQTKLERMTHSVFENSASHGFTCSRVRPMGCAASHGFTCSRVRPMGCVTCEHLARLDLRETQVSWRTR